MYFLTSKVCLFVCLFWPQNFVCICMISEQVYNRRVRKFHQFTPAFNHFWSPTLAGRTYEFTSFYLSISPLVAVFSQNWLISAQNSLIMDFFNDYLKSSHCFWLEMTYKWALYDVESPGIIPMLNPTIVQGTNVTLNLLLLHWVESAVIRGFLHHDNTDLHCTLFQYLS